MIDFLNQDNGNLLEDGHQEITTGNRLFQWLNLANPMAEELLLCAQPPGENGNQASRTKENLKQEAPSILLEGGTVTDPLCEELGYWGMAKDYPVKMSG